MKRLLVAGSGAIYQIGKAFRNGEAGRCHNPEFTMLEWYRPGFDLQTLMDEVAVLITQVLGVREISRLSYRQLFLRYVSVDPFNCTVEELKDCLEAHGVSLSGFDVLLDDCLNLLLTHVIEQQLEAVFVYDFPASQAMLAQVRPETPPVAERFELYVDGVELANGFHELADAAEQQQRFENDLQQRERLGLTECPMDKMLLLALQQGLPDCSGVALGVDRLLMIAAAAGSIEEVIAFPLYRG